MKYLLLILLVFKALSSFGADPYIYNVKDSNENDRIKITPPKGEPEFAKKALPPEDFLVYVKAGQTVARFPDAQPVVMSSIGFKLMADNFFYGLEYNSFYAKNTEMKADSVQGLVGYRAIWNNRFLPYVALQVGSANLKDLSEKVDGANGIAVTLDVGVDLFKIKGFKISSGLRNTGMTFESNQNPSANFLDLYTTFGYEF